MFEEKTMDALRWIVEILNRKSIPYQLTGGFSARLYGSTRLVNDIDIDIPEDKFEDIFPEIKPYVVFGPEYINDGKWDTKLITLNFKGQEIDLGGAYETKISNRERTRWIAYPVDFSKSRRMAIEGLAVNVIQPEDLIDYKQHLDGEHQTEDINAVKKFLSDNV